MMPRTRGPDAYPLNPVKNKWSGSVPGSVTGGRFTPSVGVRAPDALSRYPRCTVKRRAEVRQSVGQFWDNAIEKVRARVHRAPRYLVDIP